MSSIWFWNSIRLRSSVIPAREEISVILALSSSKDVSCVKGARDCISGGGTSNFSVFSCVIALRGEMSGIGSRNSNSSMFFKFASAEMFSNGLL